jgi:hypothetical protein
MLLDRPDPRGERIGVFKIHRVPPTSADIYGAGFAARCHVIRSPDQRELASPGMNGLVPSRSDSITRLLVTDDRAYGILADLLPDMTGAALRSAVDAGAGEPASTRATPAE